MKKLSVALAVYNEEENLLRCLDSVQGWADEIIVVDGGSTDGSVDVVKKFGAAVVHADNPPMFHINKQKAIDACTGEWVLQLDADEEVSKDLKKEILEVVQSSTTKNGFQIPRRNFFLGRFLKKSGQYPDYTVRLYKNGKGRLPCKSVHEQAEVDGETGYLKADLLHYNYPNFEHYLEHFNRYTTIMAGEFKEDHIKISAPSMMIYMVVKPVGWFLKTFFRHRGYIDGFAGFVFSLFSSLRFSVAYIKYWEMQHHK